MATPIITDGSTERITNAPRVVLPTPAALFAARAARFLQLAEGHPMAAYLQLMGALAQAQHAVIGRRSALPVAPSALTQSRDYGMPPLSALAHERAPLWRDDLDDLLAALDDEPAAAPMVTALRALDTVSREALADRILNGNTLDGDAALVPLAGAALQTYFTRAAAALDVETVQHCDVATVCPVCATRPVASMVFQGGARNNLRYLVCALCHTEWNMTRIKCSACEADQHVHYLSMQPEDSAGRSEAQALLATARRAEACDDCKSYLKIFYQEKDPDVDAVADDLASLALDLLVDEQGFGRSGPNLLFHPGSP